MEEKKKQARYGNDKFNRFLLLITILFISLMLLHERFWLIFAISTMLFAYTRIFSRNIEQRKAENDAFMRLFNKKQADQSPALSSDAKPAEEAEANTVSATNQQPPQPPQPQPSQENTIICSCPNCQSKLSIPAEQADLTIKCPSCQHCFKCQAAAN